MSNKNIVSLIGKTVKLKDEFMNTSTIGSWINNADALGVQGDELVNSWIVEMDVMGIEPVFNGSQHKYIDLTKKPKHLIIIKNTECQEREYPFLWDADKFELIEK